MEFNLKDFKIYCVNEEYNRYNNILNRVQQHIQTNFKNNISSVIDRNIRLSDIYKIIGKINNIQQKYYYFRHQRNDDINDVNDDNNDDSSDSYTMTENDIVHNNDNIKFDMSSFLINNNDISSDYKILYEKLCMLSKLSNVSNITTILENKYKNITLLLNPKILFPLNSIKSDIIEIANNCGLHNLSDIFYVFGYNMNKMTSVDNNLINLYSDIFVPITCIKLNSYHYTNNDHSIINENKDFNTYNIFIKPNLDKTNEELLDNNFYMYIKNNNSWLKINGYFRLDPLQIDVRLMKLDAYKKITDKREKIYGILTDNDKFKRKYLKYCSIHELITMSENEFLKYLEIQSKKFIELNNKSFVNLLKDLNSKNTSLIIWYETIKLLLLGSDETINMAGLLFSILKDKKTNIGLIPDIIYDNLVFCNQMKLKKINQTLKVELDKLNELNFESIDHKKKLASAINIPLYVRSLAMDKINEMKLNNNDYNKQLTFVKTILQFPWPSSNDYNIFQNLKNNKEDARKFLFDADKKLDSISYGHKKVKEQISLLITKWISNPDSAGTAIGLQGPPGVGKTLIAKSLAKVLDIPMIMITLGGQNDAELLIGHGYTYSGSQPGLIIKKMCEAGKGRCIMYFDELDKSCTKHGQVNEITSILIHLTDPNTNKAFQDRFFQGIDFPLDKIIFISSYNDSSKIDPILLDRLKEIEVKSYNIEDKINILKDFIIPELKENIGFTKELKFTEDDMKKFIYDFTAESGVRDLKHKTEQILLNINKADLLLDNSDQQFNSIYELALKYLGEKNKNHRKLIPEFNSIGYINGLYATSTGGGGITSIEICPMQIGENFQLKLTGSMGDVMKESIQVAFTRACEHISNRKAEYKIEDISKYIKDNFNHGFHIHAPEGATPKDGPSAGAAFTVGFISAILKKPSNRFIAMTGEMNLSGFVTKIGGLVYKLIGAKYAGVKIALVPEQNKLDIKEIKETHHDLFDDNFQYIYINNIDDVIKHTLINDKSLESLLKTTKKKNAENS